MQSNSVSSELAANAAKLLKDWQTSGKLVKKLEIDEQLRAVSDAATDIAQRRDQSKG